VVRYDRGDAAGAVTVLATMKVRMTLINSQGTRVMERKTFETGFAARSEALGKDDVDKVAVSNGRAQHADNIVRARARPER
jgi:hypothetical protein